LRKKPQQHQQTTEEEIGSGGFSELYRGEWRGQVVAIKRLKFTEDDSLSPEEVLSALEQFRQEVWIMRCVPGSLCFLFSSLLQIHPNGLSLHPSIADSAIPTLSGFEPFAWTPVALLRNLSLAATCFPFFSLLHRTIYSYPSCFSPLLTTQTIKKSNKRLDWALRLKMLKDVAKGCAFLHGTTPPIMHRDLKTPNILVLLVLFCSFQLSY